MHGKWDDLNGESVEREVTNAYKTLYKTSKVFAQRNLSKYSENADTVRQEVEDFKKFIPLVQVSVQLTSLGKFSCFYSRKYKVEFCHHCVVAFSCVERQLTRAEHLQALHTPGMRDRHWDQLSSTLGFDIKPNAEFTLSKAAEMGLLDHLEAISRITDVAGKEFSIEQALDKMEGEWEGAKLLLVPYRESGTFIIRIEDQITQQLDDHIGKKQKN